MENKDQYEVWEFKYLPVPTSIKHTVMGTKNEVMKRHEEMVREDKSYYIGIPYKIR